MSQLLSAFWLFLELWFYQYFWQWFFPKKITGKKYSRILLIGWVISVGFALFEWPQIVYTCFFLAFHTALCTLVLGGKWYQHALVVLLGASMMSIAEVGAVYATGGLLHLSFSQVAWRKTLYTVLLTATRFVLIFLGWLVLRLKGSKSIHSVEIKWLLLSSLFPLLSFSMLVEVFYVSKDNADLSATVMAFLLGLAAANIAIVYLLGEMERTSAQSKALSLMNQQRQLQTEHILALEQSYRTQRQATHEFRNKIQTLSDLLDMGQVEQAQAYLRQIQQTQTTRIFCTDSGNPVIDAIMNHKNQEAQKAGIDMQVQLNDLSGVNISPDMITMLLCNLLDNAIEGCCRVEGNREILCKLIANDGLFITIKNTSLPVTIQEGTLPTSKTPKEDHGYGIPRIRYILDELGGEYAFDCQKGWFTFVAEIPMGKGETDESPSKDVAESS